MARLKLKDGVTYQQVGQAIADIATSVKQRDGVSLGSAIERFKNLIREEGLIDEEVEATVNTLLLQPTLGDVPELEEDSVQIVFHVDRTLERDGHSLRIVNVVVPDFDDKLLESVRDGEFDVKSAGRESLKKAVLDLDAVAKEAFGFITICGCGE